MAETDHTQLAADLAAFDRAAAASMAEFTDTITKLYADEAACRWWLDFSARCAPDPDATGLQLLKARGLPLAPFVCTQLEGDRQSAWLKALEVEGVPLSFFCNTTREGM